MRNQSYRRHQRERSIARVEHWLKETNCYHYHPEERDENRLRAVRRAKHPQSCSLSCCGNPRKWWKEVTLQEERAQLRGRDEF